MHGLLEKPKFESIIAYHSLEQTLDGLNDQTNNGITLELEDDMDEFLDSLIEEKPF